MSKIVNINKGNTTNLTFRSVKDKLVALGFLLLATNCLAQNETLISAADSIAFADSVKIWTNLPPSDSLADWQITTATEVTGAKITQSGELFRQYCADLTAKRSAGEEALALAQEDSTIAEATLKQLKNDLKQAKTAERNGNKALKEANSAVTFFEKTKSMTPQDRRKNLGKLSKNANNLQNKWTTLTAPPPVQEPVSVPPIVEITSPAPDTTIAPETTPTETGEEGKTPKKKTKEKTPEKPGFAKYNPDNDVALNPPKPACTLGVNRRDEFTGNVYREMQFAELFRYTNPVMKKILSPKQPHIICKAALANDASGGALLLQFIIKDVNARRTFGGLAQKSIVSLKFINGEIMTLFNESTQEVKFDPEQGVAVFTAQYPFQAGIFKKLEKMELDQIRVAWSTGYEDYNVQQVGLLQQQASCLK